MSKEKCTCGCNTDIITLDGMVFSDHTCKWMEKSEWDKMYKNKPSKTKTNENRTNKKNR